MSTYVFDPTWTAQQDRLLALESLFDDASTRHLIDLGVTQGWRCLEVGCGAGGIARWLARRVGLRGCVVAIDLDTSFVDGDGYHNLEVRQQDLMCDPLEEGVFDLVHARAVVEQIPDRQGAMRRVAAALRPGGWAVIEDTAFGGPIAAALAGYVHPAAKAPFAERMIRAVEVAFSGVGVDAAFGTRLVEELEAAGLEGLGGVVHTPLVAGGTERWLRGTVEELGPRLAGTGLVTEAEVARFLELAADASFRYAPPFMVTAWGRRPLCEQPVQVNVP
ncbi:MAG: methyltransferase domain-containing protein [Candidatus Dormibacteraeota bacterium]|nr:methyltransferase domain-containing protein [Candidatus Dormibacteraeota bacterium]